MGCDIHAYLEYRSKVADTAYPKTTNMFLNDKNELTYKNATYNFYATLSLSRYYTMFAKMADVRNYEEIDSETPKGLPSDASMIIIHEALLYILSNNDTPRDSSCRQMDAERWLSAKISLPVYSGDKPCYLTNPDWHSHSWLSMNELSRIIKSFKKKSDAGIEYLGILDLMKSFDKHGFEMRLVFWFDN